MPGGNAGGDALEQRPVELGHLGGHDIDGVDAADDAGPVVGALALAHAGGAEIGHDGKVLPNGQAGLVDLLTHDGVGLAQRLKTVAGDDTEAADTQAGAGERLALDHVLGQTELTAHDAHLVLVQQLNGLAELKLQVLGQTAHIVMGLHAVLRLQDVGVDGALGEEADLIAHLSGLFLKHANELGADDLALGLGLGDVDELIEEAVGRVHVDQVRIHLVLKDVDDLLALALAHKAVVHVHANELLADGPDEERRDKTVENYLKALESAYILSECEQNGIAGKQVLGPQRKFYPIDTGLRNLASNYAPKGLGAQLECVVFNELVRRGYNVTVGALLKGEVDFVADKHDERLYIQVTETLASPETYERELAPFSLVNDAFPKLVLTTDRLRLGTTEQGVRIENPVDWLLKGWS